MVTLDIITKDDLISLKEQIINELAVLIKENTNTPKKWVKSKEARMMLNISSGSLFSLRVNKKIRFSKIGASYYYSTEDIQNLLQHGTE